MAGERKKFCIPCCQKFCMLVAKNSVFLFAKNSVFLFTDHKGSWTLMPGTFVSSTINTSIKRKFSELEIHKRRRPIEDFARELNPVIGGIIQYFHKFWNAGMRPVWNQLNHRLLKWVKWEKWLYKYASLQCLRARYKEQPTLFGHWRLVQP
jgi:hypothetical protein